MPSILPAAISVDNQTLQQSALGVISIKNGGVGATQLAAGQRAADHWSGGWVDQTGSRARDVVYHNTGTTAIAILILYDPGNATLALQVDTPTPPVVAPMAALAQSGAGTKRTVYCVVAAGSYYQWDRTVGTTDTITSWFEATL